MVKRKMKNCKICGEEMGVNVKCCPKCGAKNKKPLCKRWWFWLILIWVIGIGKGVSGTNSTNLDDSSRTEIDGSGATVSEEKEEVVPDITLSTEFEKEVWDVVTGNGGKLHSIETQTYEDSEDILVIADIRCKNDEDTVNIILEALAKIIVNNDTKEEGIFVFGDIKKDEEAPLLLRATISKEGVVNIVPTSNYNSKHNQWITSQFSAWDGSHPALEELIIDNLNDEKSYEHIKTSYIDIVDESKQEEVNQILENAGFSQRVEIEDLLILVEFSAKNGFGGTIKSTAYGISSYSTNTIILLGIE